MRHRFPTPVLALLPLLIATASPTSVAPPTAGAPPVGTAATSVEIAAAQESELEADPRDLVAGAAITLTEAIDRALESQPGRAVEVELEAHAGADGSTLLAYEVAIVDEDGRLRELRVDATSGEVLGPATVDGEDDADELDGFRRALRHAEMDLVELVASAERLINGTAVEAELEYDDGGPAADVVIVSGRYLLEVGVEGRAGHVIEVELEEGADDDDHGDEDGRHRRRRGR